MSSRGWGNRTGGRKPKLSLKHKKDFLSIPRSPFLFLPITRFNPPKATVSDQDTFLAISVSAFGSRRCAPEHRWLVLSQVNISQRVLDDTLSLSPVSLLLISVAGRKGGGGQLSRVYQLSTRAFNFCPAKKKKKKGDTLMHKLTSIFNKFFRYILRRRLVFFLLPIEGVPKKGLSTFFFF